MAINFTKFYNGLNVVPQNTTDPDAPGDIRYNSGSNKLEIVDGSGRSSVVTESGSVSLTNKSIDATQNTIQNLTFSNFGPSDIPARRDLSNLQTTAINLSLIPNANDSINLGSVSNEWLNIYGQNILSTNLANMSVGTSDTQSGFLFQGSTTKLNTSRAPIAMGAQKITGLADPTAAQDAVTKTYVDTNFPNVTIGTANGLSLSTQALSLAAASTSTTGALTSTDWNTFNSKQAAGNYITALTGDITASGPGSAAATLATVNANIGSFGSSTAIPNFTVNAKGLITAAGSDVVIAPAGTLSGTTLNATVVSSSLTSVGTIGTGTWQGSAIGEIYGGTAQTSYTTGDILYASAANTLTKLPVGANGTVLTVTAGLPTWSAAAGGGVTTVGTIDTAASADGLTISGNTISTQSASVTNPGMVNTTTQSMAGAKTFTTSVQSPSVIVTGTGGNVSVLPATGSTTSYNLRLPAAQSASSGLFLANDGSGNTTWAQPPQGSAKNYFGIINGVNNNGNFENGTRGSFGTGSATFTSGVPTGTPTVNNSAGISIISSSQLAGSFSLRAVTQANTVGTAILTSPLVTIDIEDQAKVLGFSFYYRVQSGAANAVFSGVPATQSFSVWFWDQTNSVWIQPTGSLSMTQNAGVGIASGTLQTASNASQLQMCVFVQNAISGAVTIDFDDVTLGPQRQVIGAAVTDWQSYTPTYNGFGTPTGVEAFWRRVGSDVEIDVKFIAGTTTAVEGRVSLPSGLTSASSARIPSIRLAGIAEINTLGAAGQNVGVSYATLIEPSVTYITFSSRSSGNTGLTKLNGSSIASSGNAITIRTLIPISGWSSNVQMSSDTDTRVISFSGTKGSTQAVTANVTDVTFTSAVDRAGAWNGSQFVVPVAGDYVITGGVIDNAASSITAFVFRNGATTSRALGASISGATMAGAAVIPGCVPGDTISIRINQTITLAASGNLGIFRLSGPATIAASESVTAVYTTAAGQSIPNNTPTVVVFGTRVNDSHNAMNTTTGLYTVPISGQYRISGGLYYASATASVATDCQLILRRNGTTVLGTNNPKSGTGSAPMSVSGSFSYPFLAGDTIALGATQTLGSAQGLLANGLYNYISIERVGN